MIHPQLLEQYNLPEVSAIEPIEIGLIHSTFRLKTTEGDFIAQKLHPTLSSEETASDFLAITNFLQETDIVSPKAILNNQNQVLTKIDNEVWRLQTAVPGITYKRAPSLKIAATAGAILGKFHQACRNFDYDFKSKRNIHNTKAIHQKLQKISQQFQESELYTPVSQEIEELLEIAPTLYLPEDLPKTVIHGDPKISNIMFVDEVATSLIDLDLCNFNSPLIELGDAMRSWCSDNEDKLDNVFKVDYYQAAIENYLENAPNLLSPSEIELIPQAVKLITIELAMRFYNDYFEDNYFGWNEKRFKSRREHNLARARGQKALYHSQLDLI